MRYIISQEQLDKITFRYLDTKRFVQVEKRTKIFFIKSKKSTHIQIRYDKNYEACYIDVDLIGEISSFFSLDEYDTKRTISRWVENTLQMKVRRIISKEHMYLLPD